MAHSLRLAAAHARLTCSFRWSQAALVAMFITAGLATAQDADELASTPLGRQLQAAMRALEASRMDELHRTLQPVLESATRAQRESADRYLKDHGIEETVSELVGAARVELVLQDRAPQATRIGPRELPAALVALSDRLAQLKKPVERELSVAFRTDMPQELSDEKMRDLPALLAQAELAGRVAEHLEAVSRRARPAERKDLDDDVRAIVERNHKAARAELARLEAELVERIVELALVRMNDMMHLMRSETTKYADRFAAARRIESSAATLNSYWNRFVKLKERTVSSGSPKELEARWRQQESEYRQLSGDLSRKAYYFEEGKRWWLRGRWGVGPLDRGLAKAYPTNVRRPDRFLLYYPLRLPNPIPRPPDPLTDPRNYPVARRHMDFWRVEQVVRNVRLADANMLFDPGDPNLPKSYWAAAETSRLLGAIDYEADAVRYVGYLEYQAALRHFEELLRLTSPAEHKALEEMFGDDERFIVHSNLSREFDDVAKGSSLLLNAPRAEDPRAKGAYERRGLSWVMALARIELAAMWTAQLGSHRPHLRLSANANQIANEIGPFGRFGPQVRAVDGPFNSRKTGSKTGTYSAFTIWSPTAGENSAYTEILWDSARQHYYSLRTQIRFRGPEQAQFEQGQRLEMLLVRIHVAIGMVSGLRDWREGRWTKVQEQEFLAWLSELEELRRLVELSLGSRAQLADQAFGGIRLNRGTGDVAGQVVRPAAGQRPAEPKTVPQPAPTKPAAKKQSPAPKAKPSLQETRPTTRPADPKTKTSGVLNSK